MLTDPGRVPIGRRAWIGNGHHGASLAPDGTIDWYAHGGLSAEPDLWRLLDDSGPALRVGPVRDDGGARLRPPDSRMTYRAGTGIVETVAAGSGGRRVAVVDFLPWDSGGVGTGSIFGGGRAAPLGVTGTGGIVRLVRALSGPVDVEVEVLAGPERDLVGRRRRVAPTAGGLRLGDLIVAAPGRFEAAPLDRDTSRWRAVVRLDAGEEMAVAVGFDEPVGPDQARRLLQDTEKGWRSWLSPLAYPGPYRAEVEQALVSMRALIGPGGAAAGAGTTSLPRRLGSERGADLRWVRLRDVARSVGVLARAGLADDAQAAETWLRHTLSTAHLPWPAWFDGDGQPVPEPEETPLTGWRRSQPVAFGRAGSLDLGVLGAVAAAIGSSTRGPGGRIDDPGPLSAAFASIGAAADWVADHWGEPDHGRWAIPHPKRLYVTGRVEAWWAFDRLARLARLANPLDLQAAAWQQEGRELRAWLAAHATAPDGGLVIEGWSGPGGSAGGTDEADAALLSILGVSPWPLGHPVVAATVDRTVARLSSGGLLYRYSDRVADEQAGPDLPDLEASLLAVPALALLERWDEAHAAMEAVSGLARNSGPGVLAETADPVSGEQYGNFPHTAAALALIEAAYALEAGPR